LKKFLFCILVLLDLSMKKPGDFGVMSVSTVTETTSKRKALDDLPVNNLAASSNAEKIIDSSSLNPCAESNGKKLL